MEHRQNPYNFVPQSGKIISRYGSYEDLPSHAVLANGKDLLSGVITCTLKAETPVCVSNGKQDGELVDFARDAEGRCIIPGSSLRGVVRTNMLTLGLCPMRSDVDFTDTHFLYRCFSAGNGSVKASIKRDYQNELLVDGVSQAKPCYLRKEGKYYIIHRSQCRAIDRHIVDPKKWNEYQDRIQKAKRGTNRPLSPYMLTELQEGLTVANPVFEGIDPNKLCAMELPVWYTEDQKGNVTQIAIKEIAKGKKGVLLAPGYMRKQNKLYLFADFQEGESSIVWKEEDRIAYQMDYRRRERTLKGTQSGSGQAREFWRLPEDNRPHPYFRFGMSPDLVILGRSPYLRIAYHHSVQFGLLAAGKNAIRQGCMDYVSALFGFAGRKEKKDTRVQQSKIVRNETRSYKSRLSFGSFVTAQTEVDKRRMQPGSPSASSFADYLLEGESYNTNFTLRGVKHYWLHDHANEQATWPDADHGQTQRKEDGSPENGFSTSLSLLPAGTEFTGNIRFKNLHRDELGLLLWCLWLGEDCYQTIGKGKALGYGRMKLTIDRVAQECPDVLYSPQCLEEGAEPERELNAEELIKEYKAYAQEQCGISLSDYAPVQDLMYIHSQLIADEALGYPPIKEYQNRMDYLPTLASYRLGRRADPDVAVTAGERQNGGAYPAARSHPRRGASFPRKGMTATRKAHCMNIQLRLSLSLPPEEATPAIAYPLYAWLLSHIPRQAGDQYHENNPRAISHYVRLRASAHRPEWVVNLLTSEAVSLFLPVLEDVEEVWLRHKRVPCVCTQAERIDAPQAFFDRGEELSHITQFPLDFLTPTSFKQQGRYVIYPQESLMLQSLCSRWSLCFPSQSVDAQTLLPSLLEGVRIADYSLRSLRYPLKQASIPSFQGRVVLEAHLPQTESALFRALYCFAPYAGMGIKTALGMGGVAVQETSGKGDN